MTSVDLQSVGQRIIWARKRKGISQERLAELIGTSRRHMLRIETGRVVRPGDVFIARIAEATEQPVEFFGVGDTAAELVEDDEESEMVALLLQQAVNAAVRQAMRQLKVDVAA